MVFPTDRTIYQYFITIVKRNVLQHSLKQGLLVQIVSQFVFKLLYIFEMARITQRFVIELLYFPIKESRKVSGSTGRQVSFIRNSVYRNLLSLAQSGFGYRLTCVTYLAVLQVFSTYMHGVAHYCRVRS